MSARALGDGKSSDNRGNSKNGLVEIASPGIRRLNMSKQTFEERVEELSQQCRWAVAFFREMSEDFGEEKALEIASRALTKVQQENARRTAEKYGATFKGFRDYMREVTSRLDNIRIVEEGDDFIRTSSHRCAAWDALNRYELPQLCRVYCDTDPAYVQAFSPKLTIKAKCRLSDGGPSCDYIWKWEE